MILTGSAILDALRCGDIVIDPLCERAVNPNSVNYRLGPEIYLMPAGGNGKCPKDKIRQLGLENGRFLLRRGNLYLGHTLERIGSRKYVTSLIGRSSIGRLGLFVQVSANLGHVGSIHRWTLELVPAMDIYVYPSQVVGQISFWKCIGYQILYDGWFGRHDSPMPSKHHDSVFINQHEVGVNE